MADILHQIRIDAPPTRVFDALTQENGLRGWWTGDSKASAALGGEAIFGFFNRATVFRMRIDELTRPKRVVWSCLGNVEEWTGTRLSFDLEPLDRDRTLLNFVHGGWRSANAHFASCNTTWGALMVRLKDYIEGREPGPFFTGVADEPRSYRRIVNLSAEPSAVYAALTTPEGLKGWWTPDADLSGDVGTELVFRFGQNYNVMRIEKLVPGREVRWECVRQYQAPPRFNKPDEWVGTHLTFRLERTRESGTMLDFEHDGLTESLDCYELCREGWRHFLTVSLKGYVESGRGDPYPSKMRA